MMEALILSALRESASIAPRLAQFGGRPAVFYQQAPHDTAGGWDAVQYPRLDYVVDWTYNPERKAAGAAQINVWCLNNGTTEPPEDIGETIREELRDLFLTDETGEVYALEWQRTDAFEAGGQNEPLTIGVTLSFDVLAFPVQATTEPDPVEGLSDWLKTAAPEAWVVGIDTLPELCRPTAEKPVLYARLMNDGSAMRNSYAVAWMDVSMAIHVFAPDTTARQTTCRALTNRLALEGEVRLRDGSPMIMKRLTVTANANPLQQGQITAAGRYGVLRMAERGPALQHIHTARKEST